MATARLTQDLSHLWRPADSLLQALRPVLALLGEVLALREMSPVKVAHQQGPAMSIGLVTEALACMHTLPVRLPRKPP